MPKLPHARRAGLMAGALLLSASLAAPLAATTIEIVFDADNFDTPLVIDNQYLPYAEGATFVYKGESADGCEEDHVTVTSDTKLITIPGEDPITVRVVEDLEYEDPDCDGPEPSVLVEKTFDWYGQDNDGNIWYFGEESYDCEGPTSCVLAEGSWEAGVDGALPGIIMLGDPQSGDRYQQEVAVDTAEDWGMAMNLNGQVVLRRDDAFPPGEFDNCLVTKEWNALEPGEVEQKTYCPDVGLVLIEEHHGKLARFELVTGDAAAAAGADAFTFRTPPKRR